MSFMIIIIIIIIIIIPFQSKSTETAARRVLPARGGG